MKIENKIWNIYKNDKLVEAAESRFLFTMNMIPGEHKCEITIPMDLKSRKDYPKTDGMHFRTKIFFVDFNHKGNHIHSILRTVIVPNFLATFLIKDSFLKRCLKKSL